MVPTRATLPQYVRLLAAHVPDVYRHGIRYFGLQAPRTKSLTSAALFHIGWAGQTDRRTSGSSRAQAHSDHLPKTKWNSSGAKCA